MSFISGHLGESRHVKIDGAVISNPASAYNKKQKETLVYVDPRSSPSSTLLATAGGQVIFDLPTNRVDELDMAYLVLTLTNNNGGGGALHPLDGYSLIDSIEVQDRGVPVQTQYGQALRKIMPLTTGTEKANVLKQANLNPSTFVPLNTIADAASLTYRIALPTILNTTQVPLWRDVHQWRIVVTFKGSTDVVLSTSIATAAQIGLSTVKLLLDGVVFEESVRAAFDKELDAAGDVVYRYLEGSRDPISFGTTVDGTVTQRNYPQTGHLAFAFLDLRSTTGTNQTQYVALDLDTAEFLQAGSVISHSLGDNGNTYDISKLQAATHWSFISKLQAATHWTNPLLLDTHNAFIISFSDQPEASLANGSMHGAFKLRGNSEVLRITPGNSGTNNLWVFGYWASYIVTNYANKTIRVERKPIDV